jgi:hypothetical protein
MDGLTGGSRRYRQGQRVWSVVRKRRMGKLRERVFVLEARGAHSEALTRSGSSIVLVMRPPQGEHAPRAEAPLASGSHRWGSE